MVTRTNKLIVAMILGLLGAGVAWAGEPQPPAQPQPDAKTTGLNDIDSTIAQLCKKGLKVQEVIKVLGPPKTYFFGDKIVNKDDLPEYYCMQFQNNIFVFAHREDAVEFRCEGDFEPGMGFTYRGLHLGSSLEDVLRVIGQPSEIVEGKPNDFSPGVLFKNIEGRAGICYYHRPDQNIRFFFSDYKVAALYIVIEDIGQAADCVPLTATEIRAANALVQSAGNTETRGTALAALQNMISADKLKAYAWWQWQINTLRKGNVSDADLLRSLKDLRTLSVDLEYDAKHNLRSITTGYFLKDGTKVLHGPFTAIDENGRQICGEFRHGLKDGHWLHWDDKSPKPVADGYWDNGRPLSGSLVVVERMEKGVQVGKGVQTLNFNNGDEVEKVKHFSVELQEFKLKPGASLPNLFPPPEPNKPQSPPASQPPAKGDF